MKDQAPAADQTDDIVVNGDVSHDDVDSSALALCEDTLENDVFDETQLTRRSMDDMTRSFRRPLGRNRQESTSLQTHPILDDNLQDFHQHRLIAGKHPLDINYNMYGMVVSWNRLISYQPEKINYLVGMELIEDRI